MSEIEKRCTEIADRVEPGFRVTGQRSCASHSAKRWNAAYEAARLALSAQAQEVAALADDIEKLNVDYNISEFYGLSDWAAFAAGVAKGRAAAAELVRIKAPERR